MLVLLYIRNISETIKSFIDNNKYITDYRILNKLTGYIKRHKDINEHDTKNNIVYKIFCNNSNASYVGQTKRQLKTRIKHKKNMGCLRQIIGSLIGPSSDTHSITF